MIDPELIKRYPPESEERMSVQGKRYTICEILREIYNLTDSEGIKIRTRVATTMAKRIIGKLYEYNPDSKNSANLLLKKRIE